MTPKNILFAFLSSSLLACSEAPEKLDLSVDDSVYAGAPNESLITDHTVTVFDATEENGGIPADDQALALQKSTKFDVTVSHVKVVNDKNNVPLKGDKTYLDMAVRNVTAQSGEIKITPFLSSSRFSDFDNVRLPTVKVNLKANSYVWVRTNLNNFFKDEQSGKQYALNRGDYSVRLVVEGSNLEKKDLPNLNGSKFAIGKSNVVFTAVFWSPNYLKKIKYNKGISKFLEETYSRKSEVRDEKKIFSSDAGGFDDMMNVKTVFRTFEGFPIPSTDELSDLAEHAQKVLGLPKKFANSNCNSLSSSSNHGYDMAVGLTEKFMGGVGSLCGNVQVSGLVPSDLTPNRAQVVLIHETGHNFGAPHCDPLKGFVMCGGEKHDRYKKDNVFVWLLDSKRAMRKSDPDGMSLLSSSETEESEAEVLRCDHE